MFFLGSILAAMFLRWAQWELMAATLLDIAAAARQLRPLPVGDSLGGDAPVLAEDDGLPSPPEDVAPRRNGSGVALGVRYRCVSVLMEEMNLAIPSVRAWHGASTTREGPIRLL